VEKKKAVHGRPGRRNRCFLEKSQSWRSHAREEKRRQEAGTAFGGYDIEDPGGRRATLWGVSPSTLRNKTPRKKGPEKLKRGKGGDRRSAPSIINRKKD